MPNTDLPAMLVPWSLSSLMIATVVLVPALCAMPSALAEGSDAGTVAEP